MQLPSHVVQKFSIMEWLPWFSGPAFTVYPRIYMPKDVYADLCGQAPSAESLATLAHEEVHWSRQREIGILRYGCKYLLIRSFRYKEELMAVKKQVRVLISHGKGFDIEQRAKRLSSYEYLWCASKMTALADLERIGKDL